MLRDITAAVDERCGGLLAGVLAPQSGLHSFSLLSNSVVAEVDDALATSRPGALCCRRQTVQLESDAMKRSTGGRAFAPAGALVIAPPCDAS